LEESVNLFQQLIHANRGEELGNLASDLPEALKEEEDKK
jgi:hypothetical protein